MSNLSYVYKYLQDCDFDFPPLSSSTSPGSWVVGVKEASCFLCVMHYPYPALPGLLTEEEQRGNPKPKTSRYF